jgi:superfamily II DNA or RNA helicase
MAVAGYAGIIGAELFQEGIMGMELRPYQIAARDAVLEQWKTGLRSTLLVLPTGTGKTIVFASIIEQIVRDGGRALILAHRGELLDQAADKLAKATGLGCALEKAESSALDSWFNVVVGSVQTMAKEKRRTGHDFSHIIIDEAHHAISPSYQAIIADFPDAKLLGVTATADRGDKRNLGEVFETLAYEYALPKAIKDGYLVPIKALTIPLSIDLDGVKQAAGDFQVSDLGTAIDPYLEQIADRVKTECATRKTVVFLPLIATSQKFLSMLLARGISAREVNGSSTDRAETLAWFDQAGAGTVLCNAMLLTEGWDCPSADCICVLRPTKIRSLYAQMVGRGTRLFPGKEDLLLLDFLWHSERHELCRPSHLVCDNPDLSKRVSEIMAEESQDGAIDLLDAEEKAESSAAEEREESLRKLLEEQRHRKRALVDPLQYEMSIGEQLENYSPDMKDLRALAPPSTAQLAMLEKFGIFPDDVTCQGHASRLIETVQKRRDAGLTTPKQIRFLEGRGFADVGKWEFSDAKRLIDRIAANSWRVPNGITPKTYVPAGLDFVIQKPLPPLPAGYKIIEEPPTFIHAAKIVDENGKNRGWVKKIDLPIYKREQPQRVVSYSESAGGEI